MVRIEREVVVVWLDTPVRGPGGHWYCYKATFTDDPTGLYGCGQTVNEARGTLIKLAGEKR